MMEIISQEGNVYKVLKDGQEMTIVTRDGQTPEDALSEFVEEPTYAEKRLAEYPSIQDQLDMIYHDFDSWRDRITSIKQKYPKTE